MLKAISENYRLISANIYLFKVNERNTRKLCEICPNSAIMTPERRY